METTMDIIAQLSGLSKTDITALRTADDVYAVFYEDEYKLRAIKRVPYGNTDPWADDKRLDITVEGSITVYGEHAGMDHATAKTVTACFASLWDSTGVWQIVKPGDRVKLRFHANAGSDNTRAVGYVRDSVSIEVIRKADVNGRKPLKFHGADYVGPNNSARFVRSSAYGL